MTTTAEGIPNIPQQADRYTAHRMDHQTRTVYVRGISHGSRTWIPVGQICVDCEWSALKRDRLHEAIPDKLDTCPKDDDVRIVQRGSTVYRMRTGRIGEIRHAD